MGLRLAALGKDREWLRERADRVLVGWLNELLTETEDARNGYPSWSLTPERHSGGEPVRVVSPRFGT